MGNRYPIGEVHLGGPLVTVVVHHPGNGAAAVAYGLPLVLIVRDHVHVEVGQLWQLDEHPPRRCIATQQLPCCKDLLDARCGDSDAFSEEDLNAVGSDAL